MKITRGADTPSESAGADHFHGSVSRQDYGAFDQPEGTALHVSFPAGARSHWHSHPDGQLLYVTDGTGRVGTRDGRTAGIEAGDLVYAAPGEEHWHGASTDEPMRHLALSFGVTQWFEPVED
jgi:quercetin dioxygenase-like cupin family protein